MRARGLLANQGVGSVTQNVRYEPPLQPPLNRVAQEARQAQPPPLGPQPQEQQRRGPARAWADRVLTIVIPAIHLAIQFMRRHFMAVIIFLILSLRYTLPSSVFFVMLFALAIKALSLIRISWHTQHPPAANAGGNAPGDGRAEPRSRSKHLAHLLFLSVATFFVSVFPSFRVDAFERELAAQGIVYPDPQPDQGQAPVADDG